MQPSVPSVINAGMDEVRPTLDKLKKNRMGARSREGLEMNDWEPLRSVSNPEHVVEVT